MYVTGVICRVVTPKDKERYPRPLTKQNAQGPGLHVGHVGFVTPKDKEKLQQAPSQRDKRKT